MSPASTTALLTIDLNWLGHAKAIATYALSTTDGVVLIDPGPHSTVDSLRAGLESYGLSPDDVRHIIVTHIHLDHAGSAWWWAQHAGTTSQKPTVYVHSFGAKHLIDPSRLTASALRIYGAQMKPMWGSLNPIDASQVRAVNACDVLRFGDIELEAIETPGHARHHHAYTMNLNDESICFCGDVAAMTVPGRPAFVSLPTPPPEFDLEQWLTSIERIRARGFDALYPTHFGRIAEPPDVWLDRVAAALREHVAFLRERFEAGDPGEDIRLSYRMWLGQHAADAGLNDAEIARHVTDSLVGMNCSGIVRYLQQLQATPRAGS